MMKMKNWPNSYKMKCMEQEELVVDNKIPWEVSEWETVENQLDKQISNKWSP